jgi:1-acyl-sn-glycerol-3-phosphate acyltransferase
MSTEKPKPKPVTPIVDDLDPWMIAMSTGVRGLLAGLTRVRVDGAIDAIPREGPLIIAANHASNLDVPVIASSLMPKTGRRWQWLGKRELFDWPVVGAIAIRGGVHAVDRDAGDVEAYRLAKRILDDGHILFVFPEGTRSRDGALQPARDGAAVLALRTGAPIVPIGIAGSFERWPRGQKVPHPGGRVTVRVGSPFRLAEELPAGLDRKTATPAATDLIMRRIAALLPPSQRGRYGDSATGADPDAGPNG